MRLLVLLTALLAVVPVRGQVWPEPTLQGTAARRGLVRACVGEIALLVARPPVSVGDLAVLADVGALRLACVARRDLPAAPLRDALVDWGKEGPRSETASVLLDGVGVQANDPVARGFAAGFRGRLAQDRFRWDEAVAEFEASAAHFPVVGPWVAWKAACLSEVGQIHSATARLDRALTAHTKALELYKAAGPARHPDDIAASLVNIGNAHLQLGDHKKAAAHYRQALGLRERAAEPDPQLIAQTLGNLALVAKAAGEMDEALAYARRSLTALEAAHPRPASLAFALAFHLLGGVYHARGEDGRAIECYERASTLAEPAAGTDPRPLARSLGAVSTIYAARGDFDRALECGMRALRVFETVLPADHPDIAVALNNLAIIHGRPGDQERAIFYLDRALRILERNASAPAASIALCLDTLGNVHSDRGDPARALDYHTRALKVRQKALPPHHPDLAASLINTAVDYAAVGALGRAVEQLDRALTGLRVRPGGPLVASALRPDPMALFAARHRAQILGRALPPGAGADALRTALRAFDLAAELAERVRTEVLIDDGSRLHSVAEGADLLPLHLLTCQALFDRTGAPADLGRALEAAERARGRGFLDALARAQAGLRAGAPPDLRDRERAVEDRIRAIDRQTRDLLDTRVPGVALLDRLAELDRERTAADEELRGVAGEIERVAPAYAALKYPRPCTLTQARAALAADEVALVFAPGDVRSAVLLLAARPDPADPTGGLRVYELPGVRALENKLAALTDPDFLRRPGPARDLGAELFDRLLGPLADRLRGKHLVIVPDGPLCHLPFELLVEDGRYLVETRRIRYAPSLTALHLVGEWEKARPRPDRPLFAVGDPVFGPPDPRLKTGSSTGGGLDELSLREGHPSGERAFPRLEHSAAEVNEIARLLRAGPGVVLTDFKATVAGVRAAGTEIGRARYVHFATHGVLGLGDRQPPALILGRPEGPAPVEQRMRLDEIPGLPLNADLVVLGACRTGRGRLHAGEGVSSLARAFLTAGSRGVVCSLWAVDDLQTRRFMVQMYQALLAGRPAAGALQAAKVRMIEEGLSPFYWAPFILQGE